MKLVPYSVTRSIGRSSLQLKKNSPHIFFVGGIIGVVGSTVLACRATLKLEPVLDEIKNDLDNVKRVNTEGREVKRTYSDSEYVKDLGYVYGKSVTKIGQLYGPAILLGSVSIAALAGSHIQMTRRNSALTATLAAFVKSYDEYRERVREAVGEERERDIYLAAKTEEIDKDGKKELAKVVDPTKWSPYARIFDETSPNWTKDPELNRLFIHCQQSYANHRLNSIGHVFLNEVYDSLGFERTSAGAVVGWVRDGDGDNFVDFGIFDSYSSRFINGIERSVILDFNVDGVIYDKI